MTESHTFGLACWHGSAPGMTVAHTHDDLEFNAASTDIEYLIDGRPVVIPAGAVGVFWAARPHQLVRPHAAGDLAWLTVPLGQALGWRLRSAVVTRLFSGEVLVVRGDGPLALSERVGHWRTELAPDHALRRPAVSEVEAFVLRVAHAAADGSSSELRPSAVQPAAARMAAWIAVHAGDDVRVADVAASVHLHPHHAMSLFRAAMGVTIGEYILQCRIARAQHLLVTTTLPVPEVATSAGFGSLSQFYARFVERRGLPPAAYRRRMAAPV